MVIIKGNSSYNLQSITKITIKHGKVQFYSMPTSKTPVLSLDIPNNFLGVAPSKLHKGLWSLVLSNDLLHTEEDVWFNLELLGLGGDKYEY